MGSIREITEKIKGLLANDRVFYITLIALLSVIFFILGRLSSTVDTKEPIRRIDPQFNVQKEASGTSSLIAAPIMGIPAGKPTNISSKEVTNTPSVPSSGSYVASKKSDKYHLPWCSGAQRISEENKVWFASKEEAEAAGYAPAGNCPGI
ncbi:hypothetical protein K2X96_01130 [Patescibacteria group bacterium]|nr:hypothetical protein [Patescibacteria group bacterium]